MSALATTHRPLAHLARMAATETIAGLWRAFPDLARVTAPGTAEPRSMGFVSRAWRPIALAHRPVSADTARERIMGGPAWAGSVPGAPRPRSA